MNKGIANLIRIIVFLVFAWGSTLAYASSEKGADSETETDRAEALANKKASLEKQYGAHANKVSKEFVLERDQEGMKGYCRTNTKSGFKYCKIEALLETTVDELMGINTDPEGLKEWMTTVAYSNQIERLSDTNYVNHLRYDVPWPFQDRESATRSIIKGFGNGGKRIEFKTVKNAIDVLPNNVEMELVIGYWQFEPVDQGVVNVEYATMVNPGGNLEPIFYNLEALNIAWETMKGLKRVIDSGKYKNQRLVRK